jgi:fructoselysine-6-P-deglycase FrlB-like protein
MKPHEFRNDVFSKVENLERLSEHKFNWPDLRGKRLFFLGMGSSFFVAQLVSHRLQMAGINAFPILASIRNLPRMSSSDVVIAITASGKSVETLSVLERLGSGAIVLTNNPELPLTHDHTVVGMHSLPETGGVASLTYQATLAALLDLEQQLTGDNFLSVALKKASQATQWVLDNRADWESIFTDVVAGGAGAQFVSPLERLASARQSALMMRECPRLPAEACEAGDWAHIDVYLTKNHDLRLVIFAGSPWQDQILDWTTQRNRRVILVGGQSHRVEASLEFPEQDDDLVALFTETTFAELIASDLWAKQ